MSTSDDVLVGRYRLLQRIGAGGMGVVWRAYDERLGRDVAVKRLHPSGSPADPDGSVASHRALREARITARLHHPHAVPVFDVVEHRGQPCLVMQYFPSSSLAELVTAGPTLAVPQVARIGAEAASALAAVHAAGIVHRDVKPANVLVSPDGVAKISDFGISRAMGDVSLTSTGLVTGTPAYLAPEVARGEPATPASDVYSLGSTLYTVLEGHPPFGTNDNPMALLHRVASGDVEAPARSGALTAVLTSMLAFRPQERPDMAEVVGLLREVVAEAGAGEADVVLPVAVPADAGARAGGAVAGDGAVAGLGTLDAFDTRSLAEDTRWAPGADEERGVPIEPTVATGRGRRGLLPPVLALVAAGAAVAVGVVFWPDDASTAAPTQSLTRRTPTSLPSTSASSSIPVNAPPSPGPPTSDPTRSASDPAPAPRDPAPTPSDPGPSPSGPGPSPSDPAPSPSDPGPSPSGPGPSPSVPGPSPSGPAPTPSGPAPTPSPSATPPVVPGGPGGT